MDRKYKLDIDLTPIVKRYAEYKKQYLEYLKAFDAEATLAVISFDFDLETITIENLCDDTLDEFADWLGAQRSDINAFEFALHYLLNGRDLFSVGPDAWSFSRFAAHVATVGLYLLETYAGWNPEPVRGPEGLLH